jgi:hypothetical protein
MQLYTFILWLPISRRSVIHEFFTALKGVWHEIFYFTFLRESVSHQDHFDFFRKFVEIIANECLSVMSTTPLTNLSPVSTTLWLIFVADFHRCRWRRERTVLPILACLHWKWKISKNAICKCKAHSTKLLTKYEKNVYLKIFLIYRRCHWHCWSKFIRDYLRIFSKKFETIPMGYSGARGTLIYEKT